MNYTKEATSRKLFILSFFDLKDRKIVCVLCQQRPQHVQTEMDKCGGKVQGSKGAAATLGVNPSTLRNRMRKLGIPYGRKTSKS